MDNLMAHINRGAVALQRFFDNLDGAIHAGAKAARSGEQQLKGRLGRGHGRKGPSNGADHGLRRGAKNGESSPQPVRVKGGFGMWRFGVLILAGLVAACGTGSSSREPALAPCPRVTILADGADITRYRPGAPTDLAAMVVDGRMAGVSFTCDYVRGGGVEVKIAAIMDVERGPASRGNRAELPWFLAVTSGDDSQLVERKDATLLVNFEGNQTRARVTSAPIAISFQAGRSPADYRVRLSFALTAEELDRNRRRGPR
jgi:hypothetical protein